MQLLIDADACPREITEIIYKAAERTKIIAVLFANQRQYTPPSTYIKSIVVPKNRLDAADDAIVEMAAPGDLVITADIPLADRVIKKGARVIDMRGEELTENTIGERLAARDLLKELREQGLVTGGPQAFSMKDRQRFANGLNAVLQRGPDR